MHTIQSSLLTRVSLAATLVAGVALPIHAADPALLDPLVELDYKSETGTLKHAILGAMQADGYDVSWEAGLLQVVTNADASMEGRQLAAELLKQCLRADSVAVLLPLLSENRLAHLVRDLVADVDGEVVDAALIEALPHSFGRYRVGLLSTLAKRKATAAVPAIIECIQSGTDHDSVAMAMRALGAIGGEEAGRFFVDQVGWLQPPAVLANAYAEGALLWLDPAQAPSWLGVKAHERLAGKLLSDAPDEAAKHAAYRILQRNNPDDFRNFVAWMRSGSEEERYRAAAGLGDLNRSAKLHSLLRKELASWDPQAQLLVLEGWLDAGDRFALTLARECFDAEVGSSEINESCLRVFAAMGELDDAKRLLSLALEKGDLAASVVSALSAIPDSEVNAWLMQVFSQGEPETQEAILELIVGRGMRDELAALLAQADSFPRGLQRSIYRAIGTIGNLDMVDELMRQRLTGSAAQNDIERAIVDIGRRFPTPVVSERLIADWKAASGDEKDRLLRMVGAIDQPNSIEVIGALIMEPEPNALAFRAITAMDAFEAFEPLQQFLGRDDVSASDRNAAWRTLFRITRRAMETWRDDRNEFWLVAHACAPGSDEILVMIRYTTEVMRGEFVPWLEELSVPAFEAERLAALDTIKKEFGME